MDVYASRLKELLQGIEEKLKEIPYVDKLMNIKGIGMVTVSGFIAEVGDIGRFDNQNSCKSWMDTQSLQTTQESITAKAGLAIGDGND